MTASAARVRLRRPGIFGIGSVASALPTRPNMLIVTRAFMGIGGALIMPARCRYSPTCSTTRRSGPGPSACGPAWLGAAGSARHRRLPAPPLLVGIGLPDQRPGRDRRDRRRPLRAADLAGPEAPSARPARRTAVDRRPRRVLWAIIEAPNKGWTSPTVLAGFVLGVVLLFGFIMWELHCSHPMLDVRFFRNRRFTAANSRSRSSSSRCSAQVPVHAVPADGPRLLRPGGRHRACCRAALLCSSSRPLSPRLVERFGTKLVVGVGADAHGRPGVLAS